VSAKVKQTAPPQNQLVLSSKLKQENISAVLSSPTSVPCVNGCGFYGTPENYGYCGSCVKLLADSASRVGLNATLADSGGNNNNNNSNNSNNNSNNNNNNNNNNSNNNNNAVVAPPVVAEAPVSVPSEVKKPEKPVEEKPKPKKKKPVKKVEEEVSSDRDSDEPTHSTEEADGFLEVSSHSRHSKFTVLDADQVREMSKVVLVVLKQSETKRWKS
jgi:hypothetical protein